MIQKKSLIRIVKSPEGDISSDFTNKKSGRGAYICPSTDCFNLAVKKKALSRALKTQIPEDVIEELKLHLEGLPI
jgi:predicted RNA-binding protein YlxR (DUF448 family)